MENSNAIPIAEASSLAKKPDVIAEATKHLDGATCVQEKVSDSSLSLVAPQPAQVKAATWQDLPATESWCPETMRKLIPWASDFIYKDNYDEKIIGLSGWHSLAATRRGKMHANNATHREDAYAAISGENFLILVASDGAGSSPFSRVGSEMTVRGISEGILERLSTKSNESSPETGLPSSERVAEMMEQAFDETVHRLRDLALKSKCKPQDLHCTLLVAVLCCRKEGDEFTLAQIGDGFFASLNREGIALRQGKSDSGDFSGQVNTFVPDENSSRKFHDSFIRLPAENLAALILCTDGIEDPFYPIEKNAAVIFGQLAEGVRKPLEGFSRQEDHAAIIGGGDLAHEELGRWLSFDKRGENDDRTILLLHRIPFPVIPATIKSGP